MILFILGSFFAGTLSVLAPCVLPLLPIIVGGSLKGDKDNHRYRKPLIITASLAISLFVFTVLLKATTLLIDIPPDTITYISGGIIILLGLFTLFPSLYTTILVKLGIENTALGFLNKGGQVENSTLSAVITGAALGPVFSSCSPVYGYILATILPTNFSLALVYILAYIIGLSIALLAIAVFGRSLLQKIKFISNPTGTFARVIGVIFIAVGIMVATGYDKKFQTYVSENTPFNIDALSENLIPEDQREFSDDEILNVVPYEAPEFVGLENWINSEPLVLSELIADNNVVLLDFWTYSCINCIRNNPFIDAWYQEYKDDGFVVVGAHAPEFAFERKVENVQRAIEEQNITYPVALDNDFATWNAYDNRFWPSLYLIDADGQVRRIHAGEGDYRQTEEAIRRLLTEKGADVKDNNYTVDEAEVPVSDEQTAETYMGLRRASNFGSLEPLASEPDSFTFPAELNPDIWALSGAWEITNEEAIARGNDSRLRFKVSSKETYFVAQSDSPEDVTILLNGEPISQTNAAGPDVTDSKITITESVLYRAVAYDEFTEDYTIELIVPAGVAINVFTFGS